METEKEAPLDAPSPAPRSSVAPTEGVLDADGDTGMAEAEESGPPTPVFTLTTGQSIGVQISPVKAADLTPDTTLVDVLGETHMMRTAWRPHDPLVFAAASDTLCALWKLSGQRSSLAPTSTTLVTSSCVTALDWDSSGKMIAVATYDNLMGTITLYDKDGSVLEVLPESPRLISGLRWAGNGLQIVIVASDGQSSELFLWNQGSQQDLFSHPQLIDGPIYDTVWCTEKFVYVCGDGFVYQCLVGDKIETSQSFSSGDDHEPWTLLKAVLNTEKPVAVAASTPTAHIWIPTHDIHIRSAHDGDITGLEIRPTSKSDESQKISPIIIATSSMDDTVKIWSFDLPTNQVHCTHRLFLGTACPALALSFSPDGYAVAAASYNKLSIWNVDRGGTPLATWDGASAEAKGEGSMELDLSDASMLDRPLSWDTDGKKLALGYGKKV